MFARSIAALMLAVLVAQQTSAQQTPPATPTAPSAPEPSSELEAVGLTPPTILSEGHTMAPGEILALDFFGRSIYASEDEDAEVIGTVEDLVIGPSGTIASVIVDVGDFLDTPGRSIAVDFQALVQVTAPDGRMRLVLETTREALAAAPQFQRPDENAGN